MLDNIPKPLIIGVVAVIVLLVGFFAYSTFTPPRAKGKPGDVAIPAPPPPPPPGL